MHTETHTGLDAPAGLWWKPAHKAEKVWVGIAFAWCMVLFAMMPLWHWKGGRTRRESGFERHRRRTARASRSSSLSIRPARTAACRS